MNPHGPNPCCSRVNCVSFFFWLFLNLYFQNPILMGLGVVFSGFALPGLTWNLKSVCWDFFFSPSNLMILLQTFFCPVPLLLEFQLNIRSLDMTSHMALKLCSYFFFHSVFQFEWLLLIYLKVRWYFFYRAQTAGGIIWWIFYFRYCIFWF